MSIKHIYITQASLPATGTTSYGLITCNWRNLSTESQSYCHFRTDGGTFSRLACKVLTNTYSVNGNLNFRVNGASVNQTVSVTAGVTGLFQDVTNSDTISLGDTVNTQWTSSAGSGSITMSFMSVVFSPSSNFRFFSFLDGNINNSNGNNKALNGNRTVTDANESQCQDKFRTAGTLKKLDVNVTSNSNTNNIAVKVRKNGADGNCNVSVTAGVTGLFSDTTNTDSVSAGDLVNTRSSGSDGINSTLISFISINYLATDSSLNEVIGVGPNVGAGATTYKPLMNGSNITSPESDAQVPVDFNFTCSNLDVNIINNSTTGASSYTIRKNSSSTSLAVSVTAGTTGFFSDTSDSFTGTSGDLLNIQIINGGGGLVSGSPSMLMQETQATAKSNMFCLTGIG